MKVMNIRDQFHAFRKKMDLIRSRRRRRHKDKVSLYLPHPWKKLMSLVIRDQFHAFRKKMDLIKSNFKVGTKTQIVTTNFFIYFFFVTIIFYIILIKKFNT